MSEMSFNPVARVLPPDEWAERTPEFLPLPPEHAIVVVVEEGGPGGRILAKWGAMTAVHVHGLEVVEDARKHPSVAGALLSTMVTALLSMGVAEVLTQAETADVEALIQHAGGNKLPGSLWVIPLKVGA